MQLSNCDVARSSSAPDIVYLGAEDLARGVFSRSQALALQLARSSRVLYAGFDSYSMAHYAFDKLFRRHITHSLDARTMGPNLWTLDFITPVPKSLFKRAILKDGLLAVNPALNLWSLAPQLRRAIRKLGFKEYLLWFGTPWAAPLARQITASKICYDYMDNIPGFHQGRTRERAGERETWLLRHSDFVIASSAKLYERARHVNRNVHLVRNGVAIDHYGAREWMLPSELQSFPKPVLGYIGSVGSWFDLELVAKLAANYRQGSVVILGGLVQISAPESLKLPNIHFMGWKPHSEMPRYLQAFDVCLIPFKINDLTTAVNPIKFYEYSAAGKPTVSVRLPELEVHKDLCYLATSPDEFVRAVAAALRESEDPARAAELTRRRRALAAENSWEARGKEIDAVLLSTKWATSSTSIMARTN